MNRLTKILSVMLVLVFAFCAIASGKSKKDKLVQDQNGNTELTLGSTFEFDDLEITVGKEISFDTLKNQFSDKDGSTVVRIPLTIKNLKDEEHHLNMFFVKIFGSKGTETDKCDSYFDDGMSFAGDLRSGASYEIALYCLYDGDGTYYVKMEKSTQVAEIAIKVDASAYKSVDEVDNQVSMVGSINDNGSDIPEPKGGSAEPST